jgi:integrase
MSGALIRRTSGPLPQYVRRAEVRAALARLEGPRVRQKRAHAFLRCLWELGPRVTELLGLRVGDVDFVARTVKLVTLKQKRPTDPAKLARWQPPWRVLPVREGKADGEDDLLQELARYFTVAGLHDLDALAWRWHRRFAHAFCSRALRAVGVEEKRANPRAMRHGFAVNCAMQGTPLPVIQKLLGHADALTTSIYMQILASDTKPWLDKVEF